MCNVGTSFVPAALKGTFDGKWYTAAVGQYRVPFEFVLPRMLPQSATVAGSRHSAKNYYYLKATLLTKGGSILSSVKSAVGLNAVKMPITVLPGLKAPEGYDTPATKTKEKSFLCSRCAFHLPALVIAAADECRSSAKLKASVTVPERAFYAGQQVPISILVENPTNKIVKQVSVSIRAKRRVKAASHTMNCSITVAKSVEVLTLGKHGHRSVELLLTLPEHLHLHSFEAPHWRMRYQVVIKLHSTGLTTKTVVRIPLWVMGPLEAVPGKLAQEYGMFEAPPSYDEAASVSVSMHAAVRL